MKKKFVAAVLVMAAWASGSYALGRYHGATRGNMDLPSVSIKWNGTEAKKDESKVEVVDFVAISDSACEAKSGETVKK